MFHYKTNNQICKTLILLYSKYLIWFSKNLKDIIFKKKIAHKLYKSSGLVSNSFSNLQGKCKFFSNFDYKNYINKVQNNLKTHLKQLWKYINNKRHNNFVPSVCIITMSNLIILPI